MEGKRTVFLAEEVIDKLASYYQTIITDPKYMVSKQPAKKKLEAIVKSLEILQNQINFEKTQWDMLGASLGYRKYIYKIPKSKNTWVFGYEIFSDGIIVVRKMEWGTHVYENTIVANMLSLIERMNRI